MSCLHFEKHTFQVPEDLREIEGKMEREKGKKKIQKELESLRREKVEG